MLQAIPNGRNSMSIKLCQKKLHQILIRIGEAMRKAIGKSKKIS